MGKSADAFRTISEVAEWLETPAHVLRFWESKFTQIKPVKRAGGRRYYRPADMRLLGGIKKLLHEDGMTIKGAQKILREQGIKHVASLCTLSIAEEDDLEDVTIEEVALEEPVDTVVPFTKPASPEPDPTPVDAPQTEVLAPVETPEEEVAGAEPPASAPVEDVAETAAVVEDQPAVAEPEVEDVAEVAETPAVEEHSDAPDSAPEPVEEPPAALPGFLRQPMNDAAESETEEVAEAEPVAPPEPVEPVAGALTYLAQIRSLSPESVREIAPIAERLRSLAG